MKPSTIRVVLLSLTSSRVVLLLTRSRVVLLALLWCNVRQVTRNLLVQSLTDRCPVLPIYVDRDDCAQHRRNDEEKHEADTNGVGGIRLGVPLRHKRITSKKCQQASKQDRESTQRYSEIIGLSSGLFPSFPRDPYRRIVDQPLAHFVIQGQLFSHFKVRFDTRPPEGSTIVQFPNHERCRSGYRCHGYLRQSVRIHALQVTQAIGGSPATLADEPIRSRQLERYGCTS